MHIDFYDFPFIAEMKIEVPISELMRLLSAYDENNKSQSTITQLKYELEIAQNQAKNANESVTQLTQKLGMIEEAAVLAKIPTDIHPIHREALHIALLKGKIQAIKYLRDMGSIGLKEAKEDVEFLLSKYDLYNSRTARVTSDRTELHVNFWSLDRSGGKFPNETTMMGDRISYWKCKETGEEVYMSTWNNYAQFAITAANDTTVHRYDTYKELCDYLGSNVDLTWEKI